MRNTRRLFAFVLPVVGLGFGGCVERTITMTSNPSGALVYLNGEEIGRTPLKREFLWYGKYDVTVSKPGYEAVKTTQFVAPPVYQIVPLDLFAELLPVKLKDEKQYNYTLLPQPTTLMNGTSLMQRAREMKGELEGSETPGRNKPVGKK